MKSTYSISEAAKILNKTPDTLRRWDNSGKLRAFREPISNYRIYKKEQLEIFPQFQQLNNSRIESNFVKPLQNYSVLELFAGAGGLAIGLEKAGIKCKVLCVCLYDVDKSANSDSFP